MIRNSCFQTFQQTQKLKVHLKLIDNHNFLNIPSLNSRSSGFFKKQNRSLYLNRKNFKRKSNAIQRNKKQTAVTHSVVTEVPQQFQRSRMKRRLKTPRSSTKMKERAFKICQRRHRMKKQKLLSEESLKENNNEDLGFLLRVNNSNKNQLINQIRNIQQKYSYDRYQIYEMYSHYQSLLKFSGGSIKKFISGFQLILNLGKISLKQSLLIEEVTKLTQNLSFEKYIQTFHTIQQVAQKMAVIDYLEIIFQNSNDPMTSEQVQRSFKKRCTQIEARQTTQYIFNNKKEKSKRAITKNQITSLCFNDDDYQQMIYKMYLKELKPYIFDKIA